MPAMTELLQEPRVARLTAQEAVNFGPLSAYRRLVGGDEVPIFTGVQTSVLPMTYHPVPDIA